MELLTRALHKKGVKVASVTQPISDNPVHTMMRQLIGMFDEYTSAENGKNVRRSLSENRHQSFWNGTTPPLGYQAVEVERRGVKIKKRLEVDPVERETVVRTFALYHEGLAGTGSLGVKNTVKALNEAGLRTRRGARFGVATVHKIQTSSYYADGEYLWGVTNSRTGERNDPDKVVKIPLPPLISRDTFDRIKAKLAGNNPRTTPPRVVNGPSLLVGLATCTTCGAGMTRTGTTRRDRRYSYYSCAGHHTKGATTCRWRGSTPWYWARSKTGCSPPSGCGCCCSLWSSSRRCARLRSSGASLPSKPPPRRPGRGWCVCTRRLRMASLTRTPF